MQASIVLALNDWMVLLPYDDSRHFYLTVFLCRLPWLARFAFKHWLALWQLLHADTLSVWHALGTLLNNPIFLRCIPRSHSVEPYSYLSLSCIFPTFKTIILHLFMFASVLMPCSLFTAVSWIPPAVPPERMLVVSFFWLNSIFCKCRCWKVIPFAFSQYNFVAIIVSFATRIAHQKHFAPCKAVVPLDHHHPLFLGALGNEENDDLMDRLEKAENDLRYEQYYLTVQQLSRSWFKFVLRSSIFSSAFFVSHIGEGQRQFQ